MEIHKPKPFHNLREFLSEIVIVVIGVSIALGAEQAIEALHWHHKIGAVEDAMRGELAEDDLPQAYVRIILHGCLTDQLDHIQTAVKPGAAGASVLKLARDYAPPRRTWDYNAFKFAVQSDISSHMSEDRMRHWERPYNLIPRLSDNAQRENDAIDRLTRSRYGSRPLTQADADAIDDAVDDLRLAEHLMFSESRSITVYSARTLAIRLSDQDRIEAWRQARGAFGACVPAAAPTIEDIGHSFDTRDRPPGAGGDQPNHL